MLRGSQLRLVRQGIGESIVFVSERKVGVPFLRASQADDDGLDRAGNVIESLKRRNSFGGGIFKNR